MMEFSEKIKRELCAPPPWRTRALGVMLSLLIGAFAVHVGVALGAHAGGSQTGIASWYAPGRACLKCPNGGTRTANGERFTGNALTAAHKTLRFGTMVTVTNLRNQRTVVVRINDRGPFVKGRIIDLSRASMNRICPGCGTCPVRITWGATNGSVTIVYPPSSECILYPNYCNAIWDEGITW